MSNPNIEAFPKFDECINLLQTPIDLLSPDIPVDFILLGPSESISKFLVEPFALELEKGIKDRDTQGKKAKLIQWFASRLMKAKNFGPPNIARPDVDGLGIMDMTEIDPEFWTERSINENISNEQSNALRYTSGCFNLYCSLFDELQKCCVPLNIPLIQICNQISLEIDPLYYAYPSEKEYWENIHKSSKNENSWILPEMKHLLFPEVKLTRTIKLKIELRKHGFFNLPMIKDLTKIGSNQLIDIICSNEIPYQIAMLDFLGFIKHVENEYGITKKDLFQNLSDILSTGFRSIKGNVNVLQPYSKENRQRFTSYLHITRVQNDYKNVK